MDIQAKNGTRGFTILELMIAVGILGVLAAVAIPSFQNYQWKAKRSEAYVNLAALANNQKAYHALNDSFYGVAPPEPGNTLSNVPYEASRDSAGIDTAFDEVGWEAEGNVYFDYDTNTDAIACGCQQCFTSTAYGDVDGDNSGSAVMYVHPDGNGNTCLSAMFGYTTPVDETNAPIFDTVAINRAIDDF